MWVVSAMQKTIVSQLQGGDRRSLGQANRIAALAAKRPAIFRQLIEALWHADPVVRMRAADAAEKASLRNPRLLHPFKAELLGLLAEETQPEVRWHLPLMVPRLKLASEERHRVADDLRRYLQDRGSIVRTHALQGLSDLAEQDESLRGEVVDLLRQATRTGSPAMRARARKLLACLEHQ